MTLSLSQTQALTNDVWMPNSQDNWSMGNVLMNRLLANVVKIGSGEKVRYILKYAKSRGGAFSGSTKFDTAKKAILNAARFPWAYFYAGCTYDIEDEVQINGGESEVDYILTQLDNMQASIRDDMGISLWQLYATSLTTWTGGTKPFYGIADLMNQSDTSPAFGEINMADLGTYDREGTATNIWQAYSDATARVMNFNTMIELRRVTKVGEGPDATINLALTTETLYNKLEASIVPSQRHYDEEIAKLGFDGIKIGSRLTVVADNKCPTSYVNGINTNKTQLKAHKDKFFTPPVWKQPTDQAAMTTQCLFVGAFGTPERRANGRFTNVS